MATVQVVLPLGVRQDMVQSHRNSISGVAYSVCFNHLITACRSGVSRQGISNERVIFGPNQCITGGEGVGYEHRQKSI